MPEPKPNKSTTARRSNKPEYILRIFVAGHGSKSQKAAENLKAVCDQTFPGRYEIKVVDVFKDPKLAIEHNIIALPTVIRALPAPIRKFVGTFADENGSLLRIDLTSNHKV